MLDIDDSWTSVFNPLVERVVDACPADPNTDQWGVINTLYRWDKVPTRYKVSQIEAPWAVNAAAITPRAVRLCFRPDEHRPHGIVRENNGFQNRTPNSVTVWKAYSRPRGYYYEDIGIIMIPEANVVAINVQPTVAYAEPKPRWSPATALKYIQALLPLTLAARFCTKGGHLAYRQTPNTKPVMFKYQLIIHNVFGHAADEQVKPDMEDNPNVLRRQRKRVNKAVRKYAANGVERILCQTTMRSQAIVSAYADWWSNATTASVLQLVMPETPNLDPLIGLFTEDQLLLDDVPLGPSIAYAFRHVLNAYDQPVNMEAVLDEYPRIDLSLVSVLYDAIQKKLVDDDCVVE